MYNHFVREHTRAPISTLGPPLYTASAFKHPQDPAHLPPIERQHGIHAQLLHKVNWPITTHVKTYHLNNTSVMLHIHFYVIFIQIIYHFCNLLITDHSTL